MGQIVGRFAPTPSGYLHLGNLFSSLLAWLSAKSQGGIVILRNEDLDRERSRKEFVLQAQRDLERLGLFWDQGGDRQGPHAPYDQSLRFEFYKTQLEKLEAQKLVYPCFCTPELAGISHRKKWQSGRKHVLPLCVCGSRKRPSALRTCIMVLRSNIFPPSAAILFSAVPTVFTPINWRW